MTTNPPSFSRALYAQIRSSKRVRYTCGGHASYEQRKQDWVAAHPDATPAQYDAAVCSIARECGV